MSLTDCINELASFFGRPICESSVDALCRFAELVRAWNAKLDLTAARDERSLCEVLFADAMVLSDRAFVPEHASIVDIGSGAGAPAIPLAVLRADARVTMIEKLRKRTAFLRTALGTLDLASRVRAIEGRIDPNAPRVPGTDETVFDLASARATFGPDEWLAIGLALAPACVVFTAGEPPHEMPKSRLVHRVDYTLPWSAAPRVLARYERV